MRSDDSSRRAASAQLPRAILSASWSRSFSSAPTAASSEARGSVPDISAVCSVGGRGWAWLTPPPPVAGRVVANQHVDGGGGDAADVLAVRRRVLLDEVVGQERDVGPPLAQ